MPVAARLIRGTAAKVRTARIWGTSASGASAEQVARKPEMQQVTGLEGSEVLRAD